MFVRREVFERIGLFDPSFFMYAEEVDLCWRARAAGFHLACATRAKMWHKISVSADRDRPTTRYMRIRIRSASTSAMPVDTTCRSWLSLRCCEHLV